MDPEAKEVLNDRLDIRVTDTMREAMRKLAIKEERTLAEMARRLLRWALQNYTSEEEHE